MPGNQKSVTHFLWDICFIVWWSELQPCSISGAPIFTSGPPARHCQLYLHSLQCCCLYITQIKWCLLPVGVDTGCFPLCSSEWCFILFSFNFTLRMNFLGSPSAFVRTPSWQAPGSPEGQSESGVQVVDCLGGPLMVSPTVFGLSELCHLYELNSIFLFSFF